MNFQCKNCGGNMAFDPELQKMLCPYCDGTDCEEQKGDESLTVCASCGGEVTIDEYASSSQCPYCNNYLVFDKRIEGKYKPDRIIPFRISKKKAVECMDKEFKKRLFAPSSFLSEKSLIAMRGHYVPFYMYDYHAEGHFDGTGTKIRRWSSGNYDYVETSYFKLIREFDAEYDDVPVDASYAMDDDTMDLLEPFDYQYFSSFDPKYMSGFFGEVYNDTSEAFENRAKMKVTDSAQAILSNSVQGFSTITTNRSEVRTGLRKTDFALLPVWQYTYAYGGKTYKYYVNGTNGKVIGITPISKKKVAAYGATFAVIIGIIAELALSILGGLV